MCHMDYGDFVIDSGNKQNVDKLDCLLVRVKRCIEYKIDKDKPSDIDLLYHKYNLEPLRKSEKA